MKRPQTLQLDLEKIGSAKIRKELAQLRDLFAPFTNRVYLVGGVVRDTLLGRGEQVTEGDLEVYDLDIPTFEKLMAQLGAKGVGKSFFVYKWKGWDIALPRRESKVGWGHRGFEVELEWDEERASRRRDFTVNALMVNIFTGELKDYHGGLRDLKNRLLRHIDSTTFSEDSLRVLRGMQFAARLKFKIAPETVELCRQIPLHDLSKERIWGEFEKMFKTPNLHYGLYYFLKLGIAQKLFQISDIPRPQLWALFRLFYNKNPHPLYFFYHLRHALRLPVTQIVEPLAPPRWFERGVSLRRMPRSVTNRFLYGMAWKQPLELFITLNLGVCREWAEQEGIYTRKYKPKKIDPKNPRRSILEELRSHPLVRLCQTNFYNR